ncbi:PQQ-dependent sugar dehydrogenase [Haloquadratum walsbyi]|uniref:Glucose/sorbosone dehydrogenase n=1 Tax=Haloquadratum walsbyi J07HQW2 TaxID=1238425 RepID=U1PSX4_9EURY|nr:PQQ-dependent sugar dehydrogenase [Haloquadratum walsbyi]ERG96882.1 MAG: glucose/sorbosone dehydrogenase [Haloquadratum walsbyi J07HQW2]
MKRRSYLRQCIPPIISVSAGAAFAGCTTTENDRSEPTPSEKVASPTTSTSARSDTSTTSQIRIETVLTGLTRPWGLTHLPDAQTQTSLLTERVGRLLLVDRSAGTYDRVSGTPDVFARGQGGLLDVCLHPSFPDPSWVYLTYAVTRDDDRTTTALGRGQLDREDPQLTDFEVLYRARPYVDSTGHFGSRVIVGPDDRLYITIGDRQFKNFGPDHVAQDRGNDLGATLRINLDGSIPDANPFVDNSAAKDAIFSYGHRNAQGLAIHPETNAIWQTEFGERDGDEINILTAGSNYGWPIADESCQYGSDEPIGVSHNDREDIIAPAYSWPCGSGGFPPSGMSFYPAQAADNPNGIAEWHGDLFVGGLASQSLARFRVDNQQIELVDNLLADRGWRIRAVATAPDTGEMYITTDSDNAELIRIGSE